MSSGGGGTTTSIQNNQPPQQFLDAYSQVLDRARQVANQPLNQYQGPTVAGFSPLQAQGINQISSAQGVADPFINAASQEFGQATTPLWPGVQQFSGANVQQYLSPYLGNVLDSTQSRFNELNAQQQNNVVGDAVSRGAWGGDRSAVAQGITAGQQANAEAPVLAGILNTGYGQAQQEFNQQQQTQLGANEANAWLGSQAAFGLGNLGNEAQSSALTGANALMGAGGMEQALQQEQLNVPYYQFLQQQAYPFQTTGWLSNIALGLGSGAGGTGTGSTTSPGPSALSQGLGILGAGAGIAGQAGLFSGGTGAAAAGEAASTLAQEEAFAAASAAIARGGAVGRRYGGGIASRDHWHLPRRAYGGTMPSTPFGGGIPAGLGGSGDQVPNVDVSIVPEGPHGGGVPLIKQNYGSTSTGGGGGGNGDAQTMQAIMMIASIAAMAASDPARKHVRGRSGNGLGIVRDLDVQDARYHGEAPGEERPMLMADNVERVLPHAAHGESPNRMVDMRGIVPTLVQAIKELDRRTKRAYGGYIPRRAMGGAGIMQGQGSGSPISQINLQDLMNHPPSIDGPLNHPGSPIGIAPPPTNPAIGPVVVNPDQPLPHGPVAVPTTPATPATDPAAPDPNASLFHQTPTETPAAPTPMMHARRSFRAPNGVRIPLLNTGRIAAAASASGGPNAPNGRGIIPANLLSDFGHETQPTPATPGGVPTPPMSSGPAQGNESGMRLPDGSTVQVNANGMIVSGPFAGQPFNAVSADLGGGSLFGGGISFGAGPGDGGAGPGSSGVSGTATGPAASGGVANGGIGGQGGVASGTPGAAAAAGDERRGGRVGRRRGGIAGYDVGGGIEDDDGNIAMGASAPDLRDLDRSSQNNQRGIAPSYDVDYQPRKPSGRSKDIRSGAPWEALTAAGLGMLAGTSPYAGVNIGRGGLKGLAAYQHANERADTMDEKEAEQSDTGAYRKANLGLEAKRWSDSADHARAQLKQQGDIADKNNQRETARDTETAKYHQGELGIRREQLNQGRYTFEDWQQPDPNDPTKIISGQLRRSTKDGTATFIPTQGGGAPMPKDAGMFGLGAPGAATLHGDDYLKTLPAAVQTTVKAMVEGRQAPPTSFAMSKPYWQQMMQAANQYDPEFDQTTWGGRVKTRGAFSAGQEAKNITALNTALGHAENLQDGFEKLNNGSFPSVNAMTNWVATQLGDERVTNVKEAIHALAAESRKVFAGSGSGSLTELEKWEDSFPVNGSPEQQKGAMKQLVRLYDSRLQSLGDQYNRGMSRTQDPVDLLEPKARDSYRKLTGREPTTEPLGNKGRQPAASATPSGAPTRGTVIDGYTFKGGDPNNQDNWAKARP